MLNIISVVVGALTLSGHAIGRRVDRRQSSYADYINVTSPGAGPVGLHIQTQGGQRNATAPLFYGLMFEDISHSIDGGLYAEMIRNRAFQGSGVTLGVADGLIGNDILESENPIVPFGPVLDGWRPIGDARLSLDVLHPLSDALPTVLQMSVPFNATGEVGFLNEGWWGVDVRPQTYNASFYMLPNTARYTKNMTQVTVSLRSNLTDDVWISKTIPTGNLSTFDYTNFATQLENTASAPNSNNTFAVTFNAEELAGQTFYFSLLSLFPETYKGRANGMRKDLAQNLKDINPAYLRFPGGNNLEGYSIYRRWKWNETIGDLRERPGRVGDWGYYNTDGFGLLEYLEWTEDMDIERVLAVYSGFSLDIFGNNGTSWPEDRMQEVLQEALDELEYVTGNTDTKFGALRAQHGHPEPFTIDFVEIGNEDWFSDTYPYRFKIMYDGLKKAYPDVTFISTAYNENPKYNISIPAGNTWDTHHYEDPSYFLENFDFYDNWQERTNNPNVTVLLGEYSVFQIDTPDGFINFTDPLDRHIFYPRLISAIAEAVYALGGERNPNVVRMQSYAPTLQNFNNYQWTPNDIAFTANPDETVLSVSYYEQLLLAHFRGTQTLPVTNTKGDFNPLFWVATIDESLNAVYLKIVNAGNTTTPLTVEFDQPYQHMNGTILTSGDQNDFNFRNNQTAVMPKPLDMANSSTGSASNGSADFDWNVPAFSITVLQFSL
ncbi:MAG: hypothetical protein M4579_002142 [Chaenotheca gracillima]|nr:MAG: hypothetical protein M4579_002142 [Chaenotheca gracillima]